MVSHFLALVLSTNGTGRVFNDIKTELILELVNSVIVNGISKNRYRYDCFGIIGYSVLYLTIVDEHGFS